MNPFRFFSSRGVYSAERERAYYSSSIQDETAIPYTHLDKYLRGSVGLDFFRGKTVLDVGSGEGTYSAWIADRGGAKKVVGIELTEHRIRREYERRLSNLELRVGDIFSTPIHETFDVVFFNLVLHHLRFDLQKALAITRSSLKPGGQIIAFEPNPYSPVGLLGFALHAGRLSANEGMLSSARARRELLAAGFNDVKVGYFWRDRRWAARAFISSSFWITGRT